MEVRVPTNCTYNSRGVYHPIVAETFLSGSEWWTKSNAASMAKTLSGE